MASHGSPMFEAYARTLKRIYWAEFLEDQLSATRPATFKASIVDDPAAETPAPLSKAYAYHRVRTMPGEPTG